MAAKTFAGANGTGPFVQSFYSASSENKPFAELIRRALDHSGGNKRAAADLLKIKRTTLIEKLKRLERS